jgi:glutathione S-transferase
MALTKINQTFELREISLKNRPQELYNISSKATVPVLHKKNNDIIDESLEIMKWVFINDCKEFITQKQLSTIKLIDNDFKYWLDKYKYNDRYPEYNQNYYREKASLILVNINKDLNNNLYIFGNDFQLVDMAIFPLIRQFINVDPNWFEIEFENIFEWHKRISESSTFKSVMSKYDLWEKGNKPLLVNFYTLENTERLSLQKL